MMSYSTEKQDLPLAAQSFREIRLNNYVYVDKTAFIYKLARDRKPKFLCRPRRFGKSTVVSTLEELFLHGVQAYDGHESLFKGTALESLWTDEGSYHVCHLRFSSITGSSRTADDFRGYFKRAIKKWGKKLGLEVFDETATPEEIFEDFLDSLQDNSVVLLVDEYDMPLTKFLNANQTAEFDAVADQLRAFYTVVKEKSHKFRCVFITGITRYKNAYLLTAGASVMDISQDREYGEICGYTRAEILKYFYPYLKEAARNLYGEDGHGAVSDTAVERLLDGMTQWYDGYCFDDRAATHVFSTWSVLNFCAHVEDGFRPYWFDSAGVSTLIRKAFFRGDYENVLGMLDREDNSPEYGELSVGYQQFTNPSSLERMNPVVLLFQAGYLSISRPYVGQDATQGRVYLRLPNLEIQSSFLDALSSMLVGDTAPGGIKAKTEQQFLEAVSRRDAVTLITIFNRYIHVVDYEQDPIDKESVFTMVLMFCVRDLLHLWPDINPHEAHGRPDLRFSSGDTTVIIENKFVPKHDVADYPRACITKLEEGISQILTRNYGAGANSHQEPWRLALVFSARERRIVCCADADSGERYSLLSEGYGD